MAGNAPGQSAQGAAARALAALRGLATPVEGELTRVHRTAWAALRSFMGPEGDLGALSLHQLYDAIGRAQALLLDDKWVAALATGHSGSFVREYEEQRRRARAAVAAFQLAATAELAAAAERDAAARGIGALMEEGRLSALSMHVLSTALDELPALSGAPARAAALQILGEVPLNEPDPAEMRGTHPLMLAGLSHGAAPAPPPAGAPPPDPAAALDASLSGGTVVEYDLAALLAGMPGSAAAGLSYRLIQSLNTVRYARGAAPEAGGRGGPGARGGGERSRGEKSGQGRQGGYWRIDAPGAAPRWVQARYQPAELMRGPRRELAAYHCLAEAALEAPHFRITNAEALQAHIEAAGEQLLARAAAEDYQLGRLAARPRPPAPEPEAPQAAAAALAEAGATLLASRRAAATRDDADMRRLTDARDSGLGRLDIAGEAALTAFVERERLAASLGAVARRGVDDSGAPVERAVLERMRLDALMGEEASIKRGALLGMRA